MQVTVLLFAKARALAGTSRIVLALEQDEATVQQVLDALCRSHHPNLAEILPRSAVALNEEYVSSQHKVRDGDSLAVIPPVSGG
jgi:molybdopterin synthase sulfur carrier subunit